MMLLFVHLKNDLRVSHRVFVLKSDLSDNLDSLRVIVQRKKKTSVRHGNTTQAYTYLRQ